MVEENGVQDGTLGLGSKQKGLAKEFRHRNKSQGTREFQNPGVANFVKYTKMASGGGVGGSQG